MIFVQKDKILNYFQLFALWSIGGQRELTSDESLFQHTYVHRCMLRDTMQLQLKTIKQLETQNNN